jgi:hypothetical protein
MPLSTHLLMVSLKGRGSLGTFVLFFQLLHNPYFVRMEVQVIMDDAPQGAR